MICRGIDEYTDSARRYYGPYEAQSFEEFPIRNSFYFTGGGHNYFSLSSLNPELLTLSRISFHLNILLTDKQLLKQISRRYGMLICGEEGSLCVAVPKQNYANPGQKVEALLFLCDYNKAINPTIRSNDIRVDKTENGVAAVSRRTDHLGVQTANGTITLEFGKPYPVKPWSFQYIVVAPGAAMDLDKMNVMYTNYPHIVDIDVPGYEKAALSLRSSRGTVQKIEDGRFSVQVAGTGRPVYLYVDAKNDIGKTSTVAGREFRVKSVPPPTATIAGAVDGSISKNALVKPLNLDLQPFDTELDIQYSITSYNITILKPKTVLGPLTPSEYAAQKNMLEPGDRILISEISCADNLGNFYNSLSAGAGIR